MPCEPWKPSMFGYTKSNGTKTQQISVNINIVCRICDGRLSLYFLFVHAFTGKLEWKSLLLTHSLGVSAHLCLYSLIFNLIFTVYSVYQIRSATRMEQHWQLIYGRIDIFSYFRSKPRGTLQRYCPHLNQDNGSHGQKGHHISLVQNTNHYT